MKFDFAISFAGPQRALARELAQRLQAQNIRIFFDELFEHEMLGSDGADYLNKVFFGESKYCVALVSQDYERAAWAQLERRAAQAQELSRRHGILIPILVDNHKPSWLLPTRIYFDLTTRSMEELAKILVRKINSHPGGQYRIVAEIENIYGDDSHLSVASIGDERFVLWSNKNHQRKLIIITLTDQGPSRTQFDVDLNCEDIIDVVWWKDIIYLITKDRNKWISAFDIRGELLGRVAYPDSLQETYVTDCKIRHDCMLLAYYSGEAWYVRLPSLQAKRIMPKEENITYPYVDFLDQETVLYGHDSSTVLQQISLEKGMFKNVCEFPESVSSILTFEKANRGVMLGHYDTYLFELNTFRSIHKHELQPAWVADYAYSLTPALYALITGMPMAGNAFEVFDAITGSVVFNARSKAVRAHLGWLKIAMSSSAQTIAATQAEDRVVIFQRFAE